MGSAYVITANGGFYATDELYHYGVPGMKWGHRKKSYEAERSAYKQAKKDYRAARRDLTAAGYGAFGRKGLKNYKSAEKSANKAELDMIDAKAKYKAAKSKNSEKAEAKVYRKAMQKSGLVGSAADDQSRGRSTRIYNHLKVSKGKAYADAIEKKVEKRAYANLAASAAVAIGATAVQAMILRDM
jgi:hypothetical protein